MEIAELILMLRNEVQRSYDLIEDSISDSGQAGVYINVEKMEIDIPVLLKKGEKKINVKALKSKSFTIQKFEIPFELEAIEKKSKSEYLKRLSQNEVVGNTIQIELLNQFDKKDSSLTADNIGRIRLVLHPVIK